MKLCYFSLVLLSLEAAQEQQAYMSRNLRNDALWHSHVTGKVWHTVWSVLSDWKSWENLFSKVKTYHISSSWCPHLNKWPPYHFSHFLWKRGQFHQDWFKTLYFLFISQILSQKCLHLWIARSFLLFQNNTKNLFV